MNGPIVWEHFKDLQSEFPNLVLTFEGKRYFIRGEIQFRAQYLTDKLIDESFIIELELLNDYPANPPFVKEMGGRVPETFHTFTDETLCLGAPLAVKISFSKNPYLLGFVKTQLIPYFYSFCYREDNKDPMPFGELDHGAEGILTYYLDLFQVTSVEVVLKLLNVLVFQKYRGHLSCPCQSGFALRKCHGYLLQEIQKFQTNKEFERDFKYCFATLNKKRGS